MRALFRISCASILCFGLLAASACKTDGSSTTPTVAGKPGKPKRKAGMPKPYRVPAKPELAVYVAAPDEAATASQAYAQGTIPSPRALIQKALSDAPSEFDRKLAAYVDMTRPWAAVKLEGQDVLWLPIASAKKATLAAALASKPKEGKFGAVNLQRSGVGPRLAWIDDDTNYIALANDLRGIATARELPHELGKFGVHVIVTAAQARRFTGQAPFSRMEITGAGAHDFKLVTEDTDVSQLSQLGKLSEGALTGMLEAKQVALGVSTKYKDHAAWVSKTLSASKRQISRQNFLVRGNLEALHRRAASVLRGWDGRILAGVGPERHVLLAFGSPDPKKLGGSAYYLIEGIRDNISMARQFGLDIPKVRFAKKKTTGAGHNIAAVAITSAKKFVPKEAWALVDDKGELRIAMAFVPRAGGAMVALGPSAEAALKTWLEQTNNATPGADSIGDLLAATFAIEPTTAASLAQGDVNKVIARLLEMSSERAPTFVVVRRKDARYEATVKGPKVKPARATRAASVSKPPVQRDESRPSRPRPRPRPRPRTKPIRTATKAKPIRG